MKTTTFTILLGLAAFMVAGSQQEANGQQKEDIGTLLERAASAKGEEYHRLRSAILQHGSEATILLEAKAAHTNLQTRVVARAILSWVNDGARNNERNEIMARSVEGASRSRAAMPDAIGLRVEGFYSARNKTLNGYFSPDDELRQDAAVPFLLEVALKGPTPPPADRRVVHNYDLWARCFAAAAVGGYDGADIIPVLKELVASESDEIRTCAVIGLARTRASEAIDSLLAVMADQRQSDPVRDAARRALAQLTGQDFGDAPEKYQQWWSENKGKWPFTDRKPGEKNIRLK